MCPDRSRILNAAQFRLIILISLTLYKAHYNQDTLDHYLYYSRLQLKMSGIMVFRSVCGTEIWPQNVPHMRSYL